MNELYDRIIKTSLKNFDEFFRTVPLIIASPSNFFEKIDKSEKGFLKASMFAFIAASLMSILSIPSYKINNLNLEPSFYVINVIVSWILFSIYSIQTWFVCKVFMGRGGIIPTVSAFFYSISILVFVKFVEIPSRIIRDRELLACELTVETSSNMSRAVYSDMYGISSEVYVAIGYVIFSIVLFHLVRAIHKFGVVRAIIVILISLSSISITVSYIQRPIVGALLCAFKQNV
ncbi:hypothetical protein NK524_003573 [Vibrio cholerae]|nr:hypothetical protein [Vibrio cholerae]